MSGVNGEDANGDAIIRVYTELFRFHIRVTPSPYNQYSNMYRVIGQERSGETGSTTGKILG